MPKAESATDEQIDDRSFERRTLIRVAKGLLDIKTAESKRDPSVIIENYDTGFNANMCRALLDILEDTRKPDLEYKVFWSPKEKMTDRRFIAPIAITSNAVPVLREAHEDMTKYEPVSELVTIVAEVTDLHESTVKETADKLVRERRIKIKGNIVKGHDQDKEVIAVVYLPVDYYDLAIKAHELRCKITLSGQLEKMRNNHLILQSPHDFMINRDLRLDDDTYL